MTDNVKPNAFINLQEAKENLQEAKERKKETCFLVGKERNVNVK